MTNKKFTVEELMLDEGFLDFCLYEDSAYRPYWEHVIESNPQQKMIFEKAAANISLLNAGLSEKEILMQVEKVRNQLQSGNKIIEKTNAKEDEEEYLNELNEDLKAKPFKGFFLFSAAAIIIICLAIYFLVPSLTKTPAQSNQVLVTAYRSLPGERRKVELPDGSVVLLNTNSEVTIKNDFNKTRREVELKGEAFFHVAKDASKPFIVKSNDFSTTAIGTSFYVYARHSDKEYKVDLLEGKVKLNSKINTMFLTPGEEAAANTPGTLFTKSNFDTSNLEEWLNGKISFNKTPLNEAVEKLEKWYAVDIEIKKNGIDKKTISGDYDNVPLDDILKVISFSISCKYTYVNNTVIIE